MHILCCSYFVSPLVAAVLTAAAEIFIVGFLLFFHFAVLYRSKLSRHYYYHLRHYDYLYQCRHYPHFVVSTVIEYIWPHLQHLNLIYRYCCYCWYLCCWYYYDSRIWMILVRSNPSSRSYIYKKRFIFSWHNEHVAIKLLKLLLSLPLLLPLSLSTYWIDC